MSEKGHQSPPGLQQLRMTPPLVPQVLRRLWGPWTLLAALWPHVFFPTSLCGVLIFGCALPSASAPPPPASSVTLSTQLSLHNSLTHNLLTHNLSTHNLLTHNSPTHYLLTDNLLTHNSFTHNLLTHNLLTDNLLTHNSLTHNLLTHNSLTHTNYPYTTHSHTHTTYSHTAYTHTQLSHTRLHTHTQLPHTLDKATRPHRRNLYGTGRSTIRISGSSRCRRYIIVTPAVLIYRVLGLRSFVGKCVVL